ncbi:porin family protein [Pedobacter xixiisoli]|uniref:Outer membrane protein beta-barrel domain-containing protein n=1 Tax=Pedobacter xixiisoli TaxID=1476464 RepID=A0A285ZZX0_9SPHI|nr:porin family protein [Pedobacter xixiisoli]SOD15194.1 Outer membrane protein beta-barrel domain-containing protein [Pedobacter xixiisoli]
MKKLLLSVALVAGLGAAVNAQDNPIKIGVKAGVAFPNVSISDAGEDVKTKTNASFYFGGTVDVSISKMFSVQPGLTLIGKGTKIDESENLSTTLSNMYLELPVNLLANFPVGSGKVFVGAGPYYSMALSGKYKFTGAGETVKEDVKFGSDGDFKRGDFGLNFLGGYQLSNGFNVHAGYGIGLSNISSDSDGKIKNKLFSIGVGFSF